VPANEAGKGDLPRLTPPKPVVITPAPIDPGLLSETGSVYVHGPKINAPHSALPIDSLGPVV